MREALGRLVRRRRLSQADLYEEAQRLGLRERSSIGEPELAEGLRATRGASRSRGFLAALPPSFARAYQGLTPLLGAGFAFAFLRRPRPVRMAVLSVAAVAAGALGLMAAYAVSPEENSAARGLVTTGSTLRIATVTGPGGTTTVAITKTKQGKTRLVPIRILDTVTSPGGTETVSVAVLGPPITVTDAEVLTQIQTLTNGVTSTQFLTETQTQTQVVTEIQPVTVVVTDVVTENLVDSQEVTLTQTDTVVVTETVVMTETVVPPPP